MPDQDQTPNDAHLEQQVGISPRIYISFDAEDGSIRVGAAPGTGIANVIQIVQTLITTYPSRNIIVISVGEPPT